MSKDDKATNSITNINESEKSPREIAESVLKIAAQLSLKFDFGDRNDGMPPTVDAAAKAIQTEYPKAKLIFFDKSDNPHAFPRRFN
jgi:hypothetical protein